jgi:ABC-2 type transport system ATP-binding protein
MSTSDSQHREFQAPLAIEVTGLRKRYGDQEVVQGIDFSVRCGEIFAFLGPNGAGKTTTVEILEGFTARSAGDVRVLGIDPQHATAAWRDRVGVVLQSSVPEPDLSVEETVRLYAGFYSHPRPTEEVLALTGLEAQAHTRNGRLSGGQQRRLDVALALVGDPDLLFLDEPTTGFDPAARRAAWETVAGLKAIGKTVFLTTHYLDEAEYLADRIAVITSGRIVATGTPAQLGGRDRQPSTVHFTCSSQPPPGLPCPDLDGRLRFVGDLRVEFLSLDPMTDLMELAGWSTRSHVSLHHLEVVPPSLEDTYLALTSERTHS